MQIPFTDAGTQRRPHGTTRSPQPMPGTSHDSGYSTTRLPPHSRPLLGRSIAPCEFVNLSSLAAPRSAHLAGWLQGIPDSMGVQVGLALFPEWSV